jgi:predicted DNA binding protein
MKQNKIKNLLVAQLKKTPVVQVACERTGIARASFYRWKQQDKEFAKAADEAITEGEMLITDLSELQLINLIRDKNFPAINLWLKAHHEKYGNKVELNGHITYSDEELTPEQANVVKQALRLASFDKNHGKEKKK